MRALALAGSAILLAGGMRVDPAQLLEPQAPLYHGSYGIVPSPHFSRVSFTRAR